MVTDINLTQVNSSMINLYIIPSQNRHQTNNFNLTKLNFTWKATEFNFDTLHIELDFPFPSFVSPLKEQDTLVWNLKPEF